MFTATVLSISLVCFVFGGLTSSKPLEATSGISAQEWNKQMLNLKYNTWAGYIMVSLAAASSGKDMFEQPEPLTEDCVRTARVTMNFLSKPSTFIETRKLVAGCLPTQTISEKENPTKILCKNINEKMKQNAMFPDFEQLKTKVELPQPIQKYCFKIPQQTTAAQFVQNEFAHYDYDQEIIKLDILVKFFSVKYLKQKDNILELPDKIKPTMDSVFGQSLDEYIKVLIKSGEPKGTKYTYGLDDFKDFAMKVDENFSKNPVLKEDYKKLKESKSTHQ